jgi:phosphatidylglycerol phospholipase C
LTDVTKTWLDMRAALNGTRGRGEITRELMVNLGDYDKVCARHRRSFLWTWPLYYSAVQYGLVLVFKRRIEKAAGSFDIAESMDTQAAMVRVRVRV